MNTTDTPADTPAMIGPGARLRQARHDLKLTPEEVAQILRLSPRQILALENDDYASLPGPTYVRGYLRSYAQFLGLAPEKIMEIYNALPRESPAAVLARAAPAEQVTTADYRFKFASLVVVALVLGLSAVWWTGRDPTTPASSAVRQPLTYQTESGAVVADNPAPGADARPESDRVTQQPVPPVEPRPVPEVRQTPAAPAQAIAPAPAAPLPASRPVQAPAPAAIPPQPAPGTRARLVLRTEQESWADIRDARQNRLLYETIPSGRVVTLEGFAPISVFLGNVDGVRVEYNGHPIDAARYKRGPVARFSLGENGSTP